MIFFFFFSSRRRHTRWNCDWSSDVCSSDLRPRRYQSPPRHPERPAALGRRHDGHRIGRRDVVVGHQGATGRVLRLEERGQVHRTAGRRVPPTHAPNLPGRSPSGSRRRQTVRVATLPVAWTAPTARGPVTATVRLPGAKSMTARALVLAAISVGTSTLHYPLRARDTELMAGALRAMGTHVSSVGDAQWLVRARPLAGPAHVDVGLAGTVMRLLPAPAFERGIVVRHEGPPVPSAPHLRMTVRMLRAAGAGVDDSTRDVWAVQPGRLSGRSWDIEPDLSAAAPFLAAALVAGGAVTVPGWPIATTQPGDRLRGLLTAMGGRCTLSTEGLTVQGTGRIHGLDADLSEVSELTMVLAALAALADTPSRFTGIAHIRGHETDRLGALTRELTALGAEVTELPDGLAIKPGPLRGATFGTCDDHRMAHAAAVLGLAVPGLRLSDVACTAKTMPDFPALWESMVGGGR